METMNAFRVVCERPRIVVVQTSNSFSDVLIQFDDTACYVSEVGWKQLTSVLQWRASNTLIIGDESLVNGQIRLGINLAKCPLKDVARTLKATTEKMVEWLQSTSLEGGKYDPCFIEKLRDAALDPAEE